jgi:AAA domain, putative AbiEii toxin, Type IV TA system/AAA ATPase domain
MISTLELKQFRGLEHIKFENLGRANLIIGGNNTGKTSILEALVLLHGNSLQFRNLPKTFREQPQSETTDDHGFWKMLLRGGKILGFKLTADASMITGIISKTESPYPGHTNEFCRSNGTANVQSSFTLDSLDGCITPFQIDQHTLSVLSTKQTPPEIVSELFNQIAPLNPDNEAKLEVLLRKSIEPRLRRLRYAKPQGAQAHLVYVDLGEGPMLPFTQLGQAFARTLQIYCEIFANRPKILLIDEIENGLYYEGMEDFWRGLMAVLEDQDVQLFATTHSRECMEAAHKAAATMTGDPLRFLRLDRRIDDPSKVVATTFGQEEMKTAIEFNREMR